MARMYKSRRGKSGSSKPYVTEAPEWSNTDVEEVTKLVVELGKSGHTTAERLAPSCGTNMQFPM